MHSRDEAGLRRLIYLNQVNQAEALRTQIEHHRRFRSLAREDGRGMTMGAIYWQLNRYFFFSKDRTLKDNCIALGLMLNV